MSEDLGSEYDFSQRGKPYPEILVLRRRQRFREAAESHDICPSGKNGGCSDKVIGKQYAPGVLAGIGCASLKEGVFRATFCIEEQTITRCNPSIRMFFHQSDLRGNLAWKPRIIGIKKGHVSASCAIKSPVPGRGGARVNRRGDKDNSGVLELADYLSCGIGTAVIGDNNLQRLVVLFQGRLDCTRNCARGVVAGDYYAYQRLRIFELAPILHRGLFAFSRSPSYSNPSSRQRAPGRSPMAVRAVTPGDPWPCNSLPKVL